MKIKLNKQIVSSHRVHADKDDILQVILNNVTYFICDSKYYPNTSIPVFLSQCSEVIHDKDLYIDPAADEKFYNVLETPDNSSLEDDPLYTAFPTDDDN